MKVLVIKTSALGDIVHCYPCIDYLHALGAKIDWLVEKKCAAAITSHPYINDVHIFNTKAPLSNKEQLRNLRSTTYDVIIDLQGNIKSGILLALARGRQKVGFSYQSVSEWPNLLFTRYRYNPPLGQNIRDDYLSIVKQHFKKELTLSPTPSLILSSQEKEQVDTFLSQIPSPNLLFCPAAAWKNKQLPQQDAIRLLPTGRHILLLWGSNKEKEEAEALKRELPNATLTPKLSISALQYLMTHVDEIISMDSLPLHLAGTTKTPTTGIFGPSLAAKYAPPLAQTHQGPCPYGEAFPKRCRYLRTCKTGACMRIK